jgi:aminoglycoside phosphotransferase (APT) family kinase protein
MGLRTRRADHRRPRRRTAPHRSRACQLDRQAAAHARLREARLPDEAAGLVPWVEARERTGLADWSLERRLPGGPPPPAFSEQLLADCVDFLVVLHGADGTTEPARSARATAETAAGFCPRAEAQAIVALGERLETTLADVPRGFAHGDYFRGNLLVEDGRLVGVVDWDASGPGRLPLLDLLHLRHMNEQRPADLDWGPTVVEHLLPWARAGGDRTAREYCRRVGIEPLPERMEQLVAAYWLDRLAYQLSTYADRALRPRWLERNVGFVLAALVPRSRA